MNNKSLNIIVLAEDGSWIKKDAGIWNTIKDKANVSRILSEKMFSEYGEQMKKLREVDDELRIWTKDLDKLLKFAKRAFKAGNYLEAIDWLKKINLRLKFGSERGKELSDLNNEQVLNFLSRSNSDSGRLVNAGLGEWLARRKMQEIYDEKIQKQRVAIHSLIRSAEVLVERVQLQLEKMQGARASGKIQEYLDALKTISSYQEKFELNFQESYEENFAEFVESTAKTRKTKNHSEESKENSDSKKDENSEESSSNTPAYMKDKAPEGFAFPSLDATQPSDPPRMEDKSAPSVKPIGKAFTAPDGQKYRVIQVGDQKQVIPVLWDEKEERIVMSPAITRKQTVRDSDLESSRDEDTLIDLDKLSPPSGKNDGSEVSLERSPEERPSKSERVTPVVSLPAGPPPSSPAPSANGRPSVVAPSSNLEVVTDEPEEDELTKIYDSGKPEISDKELAEQKVKEEVKKKDLGDMDAFLLANDVSKSIQKVAHARFYNELAKASQKNDPYLLTAMILKYSEKIEDSDPETSLKLIAVAEGFLDEV